MGFVKCSECGDFVAINAPKCLNCGCPNDKINIRVQDIKKIPNTIQCLECGQFISVDEKQCPNCGCPKQRVVSLLVKKMCCTTLYLMIPAGFVEMIMQR